MSKRDDFISEFLFSPHSVLDRSDLTSCSPVHIHSKGSYDETKAIRIKWQWEVQMSYTQKLHLTVIQR